VLQKKYEGVGNPPKGNFLELSLCLIVGSIENYENNYVDETDT
jgi:hypothetical protein